MKDHYIPFFRANSTLNSLLLLDNHGSHIADGTIEIFEKEKINYLCLAPNTTPLTQPVDVGIGGVIKSKIKKYFEEWLIDSWESDDTFVVYNEKKKKKYKYNAPSKDLIIKWILRAYEEMAKSTIISGKLKKYFY